MAQVGNRTLYSNALAYNILQFTQTNHTISDAARDDICFNCLIRNVTKPYCMKKLS